MWLQNMRFSGKPLEDTPTAQQRSPTLQPSSLASSDLTYVEVAPLLRFFMEMVTLFSVTMSLEIPRKAEGSLLSSPAVGSVDLAAGERAPPNLTVGLVGVVAGAGRFVAVEPLVVTKPVGGVTEDAAEAVFAMCARNPGYDLFISLACAAAALSVAKVWRCLE